MELKKEAVSINETVMRDFTQLLVEGDIIVPDIRPDMAKILQIDAVAMVDDIMSGEGSMAVSGKVGLKILYVPENDGRPVCAISSNLEFSSDVENPAITPDSKCMVEVDVGHVDFTMLNSRKLSVRVVVEMQSKCMRENTMELVEDMEDECPIELKKESFDIYNVLAATHTKFSIKDTLDFPSGKPSAVSVLKMDAKITDKDIRIVTGKIVIKGAVSLCTLYVSADNMIEFMEHEVPFTEVIDVDGANDQALCDIDLWICQSDFDLRADVDGDMRLMDIELLFGANVTLMQNSSTEIVTDCFSAGRSMVCESQTCQFDEMVGQGRTQHALREVVIMPEDMPEVVTMYNIVTKPYITDTQVQQGKVMVTGNVDCYLLYLSASPAMPINSYKKQMEFTCSIEIEGLSDNMDCEVKAEIAHAGYNLTMTGEIEVRATLNLWAKAIRTKNIELLTNAYIDEEAEIEPRHGIVIYFVQAGDTMWNIAKKYQVPIGEVCELNHLEDDRALSSGRQLLIPSMSMKK